MQVLTEKQEEVMLALNRAYNPIANYNRVRRPKGAGKKKYSELTEEQRQHQRDKVKEWRKKNKERSKEAWNRFHEKNLHKIKEWNNKYARKRYLRDKVKMLAKAKIWDKNNRQKRRNYSKKYKRERPELLLLNRIRGKVITAAFRIKDRYKYNELISCSSAQLRVHIESQFKPGMSWRNHGLWHIDHIRPFSLFDMNCEKEVKAANHYTNLQPLWAVENLRKGSKYEETADSTAAL